MDQALRAVAERCYKFIVNFGTRDGVVTADLEEYIGEDFRKLSPLEKECVQLWISKRPNTAHVGSGQLWHFWPREVAPDHASRG